MKYDIVITYKGTQRMWFYKNKTHREDGPAIERVFNGVNSVSYVLKGQFMQKDEFELIKKNKEKSWLFYE
jgi:hypothetical protein